MVSIRSIFAQGACAWLLALACTASSAYAQTPILDLATLRPTFENFFESRRIQTGLYGQYRMRSTDTGPSNYASLDVAISRTIMGTNLQTALTEPQRTGWISHLQSYANPDGTYSDTFGHNQLHANGMTIGALGPLGGKQLYPATPLYAPFNTPSEVPTYLASSINWTSQWSESHKFWGGLHMYAESSVATQAWKDSVFNWLDANVDPATGWWRTGQQPSSNVQGLGGGAHIWPIYEQLGHAFPEPDRVIDRILSMQVSSGRFGGNNSGYMDLDALYGLKYMRSLSPSYRTAEINTAVQNFGQYLAGNINSFLAGGPTMHETLAKVGAFGLLNQLNPTLFPDSTGAQWTDIFTDQKLYQTAAVEVFSPGTGTPVGQDQPSIYTNTVMASTPRGYWRMGQTGGLAAAEQTASANLQGLYVGLGTSSGPGNLAQPGPRPAGFPGFATDNRAVHLNGSTSYMSVADTPELDITGALTMEAWIKLDSIPAGNAGIIGKYVGSGSQRSYLLYVSGQGAGNGELGMVISSDGTFTNAKSLVDNIPLTTGEWLHVVGTYQPNQAMRIYVNGTLVEQVTSGIPSAIFNSNSDLWVGLQYDTSAANHFSGLIDEVAIYNRALSASEIAAHYAAAFATPVPGDFDSDGDVDGADFVVWQTHFPAASGGALATGDADGDGDVDGADFVVWQTNFPTSPGPGSSPVPEPAALIIALCSLAAIRLRVSGFSRLKSVCNLREDFLVRND
jgi:hypothetical protein